MQVGQKAFHHRDTESPEGTIFFVYREIPIDENNPRGTLNKSEGLRIISVRQIFLFVGISRQTESLLCALCASVVKPLSIGMNGDEF